MPAITLLFPFAWIPYLVNHFRFKFGFLQRSAYRERMLVTRTSNVVTFFSWSVNWSSDLSLSLMSSINVNLPWEMDWFSAGWQIKSLPASLRALNSGQFTRAMDTSLQSLSNDSMPTQHIQPWRTYCVVHELWSYTWVQILAYQPDMWPQENCLTMLSFCFFILNGGNNCI